MDIIECDDQVRIVHRWLSTWTLVFSVVVGIYAYLVYMGVMLLFADPERDLFLPGLLISISLPLLSIIMIACWLNRTMITVGNSLIEIRSSPLPFPSRIMLSSDDIIDIYARNNHRPNRIFWKRSYAIHTLDERGKQSRLWCCLFNVKNAEMISSELRRLVCKDGRGPFRTAKANGSAHG